MIRVFIICQEEPFYIPKQVGYILERSGSTYEVSGGTVLQPQRKNASKKDWFRERARVYSTPELILASGAFITARILGRFRKLLGGSDPFKVSDRFRNKGITLYPTNDLNDPEFIDRIHETEPDVILSISPPQLFKRPLLELPKKYSLNVHGTLLPRHRGVFGSWWTLFEGDKDAGGTIHTMEEKLDAGEILWQEAFRIPEGGSQFSLAYRTKALMAKGAVELLGRIAKGEERYLESIHKASYNRAPSKDKGRAFRKRGGRIIRWKDVPPLFKWSFNMNRIPENKAR